LAGLFHGGSECPLKRTPVSFLNLAAAGRVREAYSKDDRGAALVHVFRFEGDRIAELWDIGQPVPEHSVNAAGMF
jgi:hypothetical protein